MGATCSTNYEIKRDYYRTKRKKSLNWYLLQLGAKRGQVYSHNSGKGTLHDRYDRYDIECMAKILYRDAVKRYQMDEKRIRDLNIYKGEIDRLIEEWWK